MCKHEHFRTDVRIDRLENIGKFHAEIKITCTQCGVAMQFLGLPPGLDLAGATVSLDGLEARMAIAPQGTVATPLDQIVSSSQASKH